MNPILENKIEELKNAKNYECWYLVKQPTAFDSLCYLVSFLKKYKSSDLGKNLQDFIGKELHKLQVIKPNLEISNNYRALRVAAFFGLIIMTSSKYDDAIITDTFEEITTRCSGDYENTELYSDIIQRQIEKIFISSQIDEAYKGVRYSYRLYPIMLLYKVLLELGRSTGIYSITMTEYRYLVAVTKKFEEFLETLILIKLLREDKSNAANDFEKYRTKFDNKLIQALKQLETLNIDKDSISLKENKIEEVAKKVFIFEKNPNVFTTDNYIKFLGSTYSLFELEKFEEELNNKELVIINNKNKKNNRLETGINVILYGVPGSGKSWTIEHEYCNPKSIVVRLVFHPDYTYYDFIGQILPNVSENGQVSYKFTPGPLTNILRDSYNNPDKEYILIIEEINRGNAPAIFGEVFQLLDRKSDISDNDEFPIGTSEYGIINTDIAAVMYGKDRAEDEVRIPSNLSIIGTMNTSDQNVFTLDTAFQRRWNMRLIENNFENVDSELADAVILDTEITWKNFCTEINNIVALNGVRMAASEDKRLGAYFVHIKDLYYDDKMGNLSDGEYDMLRKKESENSLFDVEKERLTEIRNAMKQNRKFPEKVIKYLWDDAFKFNREIVFENTKYQSLEQVIHEFMYANGFERFKIFKDDIQNAFRNSK